MLQGGQRSHTRIPMLQVIQQLPYQHVVKWIPSHLRSKDPGDVDCLDIQVETTAGKKDLRMRCTSREAVHTVMADIRATVQVNQQTSRLHLNFHLLHPPDVQLSCSRT
jgi:hypothetical protein